MSLNPVEDLVVAARDFVRRALRLELDDSVESLAFVDHYLSKVGEVSDEVLALVAPAIGAYFGELAIRTFGGQWMTDGEPTKWTVRLAAAPITFSPAALVASALRHGEGDADGAALDVPAPLRMRLEEALEAIGPVEEAYYYSLTGRFETIAHAVDILVELARRARPVPG